MSRAIVVGASSGIGFNICKSLVEKGYRVEALCRTEKELKSLDNVSFSSVDVLNETPDFPDIDGPVDSLIYCPGTINLKPFDSLKPSDFMDDYQINVIGAVKAIHQYLQHLKDGKGAIVLISSVAGSLGMPFHASIASAKSAVEGLTKALAAEFAPNIRVNAIAPSLTDTPLASGLTNNEKKVEAANKRHPLNRIGKPSDIAAAACFLAMPDAEWITGQVIHVDGGFSTIKLL